MGYYIFGEEEEFMLKKITNNIVYVGCDDHEIDLFEGQYPVKNGISYNSYVIVDEKIAVMDTIDKSKTETWLNNIEVTLAARKPDYLVISHMEPDHCASIEKFLSIYPDTTIVVNNKTIKMVENFFPNLTVKNSLVVTNGQKLSLGSHTLTFVFAPMVHWPEVMMSYEEKEKVLFSADAFGKFGALDSQDNWVDEARRYYFGIVGKYGNQVRNVLKAAKDLDIKLICPLHGPVLSDDLQKYLDLYELWANYESEKDGIAVFYTSIYGHTKEAVDLLVEEIDKRAVPHVVYDLARTDMSLAVSEAFRYSNIVLATTTYNADIFPYMRTFIDKLVERNFQKKTIALMENGSWAAMANKIMKEKLSGCKDLTFNSNPVTINSSLNATTTEQVKSLASQLTEAFKKPVIKSNEVDPKALFNIGYGLYVVTCNDTVKDNGLIVNAVTQLTSTPCVVAVTINKMNYSCDVIKKTKQLNISTLDQSAPFDIFKRFGFQSGKDVDKFVGFNDTDRSSNGLLYLTKHSNSFISCKVINTMDLSTHVMFICEVVQSARLSSVETMTYNYYQSNVKPKPEVKKNSYVCKVCGYVYEGESLPEDYICPTCKHPASDFQLVEASQKPKGYVCKVCGYVYEGETLPDDYVCPLCKHPASDFEPIK